MDALVDLIRIGDEAGLLLPLENLGSPLRVRAVAGLLKQPGREVEEDGVGNGVFVVVAGVECRNLPAEATSTDTGVPSQHKFVEHVLGEVQPLRLAFGRVRQSTLSRGDGSQSPCSLVIIAFGLGLVRREVVVAGASLVKQALRRQGVVAIITGLSPVIDQGLEQGSRFPPYTKSVPRSVQTGI